MSVPGADGVMGIQATHVSTLAELRPVCIEVACDGERERDREKTDTIVNLNCRLRGL